MLILLFRDRFAISLTEISIIIQAGIYPFLMIVGCSLEVF